MLGANLGVESVRMCGQALKATVRLCSGAAGDAELSVRSFVQVS